MTCFHVEEVADGRHYRAVIKSVREKKKRLFFACGRDAAFSQGSKWFTDKRLHKSTYKKKYQIIYETPA